MEIPGNGDDVSKEAWLAHVRSVRHAKQAQAQQAQAQQAQAQQAQAREMAYELAKAGAAAEAYASGIRNVLSLAYTRPPSS